MVLYSVLVPNLGFHKYLEKCFSSIASQNVDSSFSYEIIVCDQSDVAESKKVELLAYSIFKKTNNYAFRFLKSNKKGVLKARHKLLQNCSGDYVIFIDSDDYVSETYLQDINNSLKKANYPDVFFHNAEFFDDKKGIYGSFLKKEAVENIDDYFLYSDLLNSMPLKAFKLPLYNIKDYMDFETKNGDDWILSYPIMKKAKSYFHDLNLFGYYYRQNESSITHKMDYDTAIKTLSFRIKYIKGQQLNEVQDAIFTQYKIGTFNYLIKALIISNENKKSIKSFIKEARKIFFVVLPSSSKKLLSKKQRIIFFFLKLKLFNLIYFIFKHF